MNNFTKKKNSEEEYRLIIENANDLIAVLNERSEYEFINEKTHLRLTGYSREDLIGKQALDFVHPNHREMAKKTLKKAFEVGEYSGELRMKNKKGFYGWFHVTSRVFKDQKGNRKILTIKRDITKRKKIENALKESKEKYKLLFDTSPDGIAITTLDGKILDANKAYQDMLGYTLEELKGIDFQQITPEKWHEAEKEAIKVFMLEGYGTFEKEYIRKNGTVFPISLTGWLIKDEQGNPTKIGAYIEDITERREFYEALKDSEERFRSLVETTSDWIWEVDRNGVYTYSSPKVMELLGYTPEEVIGLTPFDLMPFDEAERVSRTFESILQSQKSFDRLENIGQHKDGHLITLETSGVPIFSENGNLIGYRGIDRDISERKFAEQKLKESEKNYRSLYENALVGLWTSIIESGKFIKANDTAAKIAGYKNADDLMNNSTAIDLFNYETRVEFIRQLKEHGTKSGFEAELIDRNGNKKQISISGKIDQKKGIIEGVFIDISDLKRTQKALIESQEMLRVVIDNIPIYIFWKDTNSVYMGCNKNFAKVTEIGDPENIVGKTDYDLTQIKEQADSYREIDRRIMETNTPEYHIIEKVIQPNGKEVWLDTNKIPFHDSEGNVIGIIGAYQNITKIRKNEQKLIESEEKYRTMINNLDVGFYRGELKGQLLMHNSALNEILGIDPSKNLVGSKASQFFVNPEDQEKYYEQLNDNGFVKNFIGQIRKPNGEVIIIEINAHLIDNVEGGVKEVEGTFIDITEKFRLEQTLKESEEKYRNIIENTKEGYFETDIKGNFTFSNDANCKLVGHTLEEIIGINYKNIMSEESSKRTFKLFNEVYRTGISEKSFEYEIIRKDGKTLYGESSVYLRYDSEGNKIGFAGFMRDVTEKREAEQKLKESEEKYRTIIENIKEGYFEVDLNGNFTFVNDALGEMSGYSREEGIGTSFSKYMTEESSKKTFKVFREVYSTGIPQENFQYEFFSKDGKKIYGESSIYLRYDADGNKIGFSGLLRDVTEKIEAEQKLKESEEKFRTITEQSLMGICIIQDNKIKYVNQHLSDMSGYSIEELKGWDAGKFLDVVHPYDQKLDFNQVSKKQKGLEDVLDQYNLKIIKKTGEVLWSEIYSKSIMYQNKPADLVTLIDITDKKKAEEKLKESEEKFRRITEQSILGICIIQDNVIKYLNQRLADIFGFQMEEILNLKPGELFNMIAPEYREFVMEQARKKQEGEKDIITQYTYKGIKKPDGEIWIENYSKTIEFEGRAADLITIADITDKIKAEEKLKESEEKYRNMINDLDLGFYQLAWDGSVLNINPAFRKIMGYKDSVALNEMNSLDFWKNDEDRKEYVISLLKNNVVEDYIAKGKNIYGQDLVLQVHSHLIRDKDGTPIKVEGTGANITEKYNLEQKLKRSEERYRFLFENSPFAILLMDSNGVIRDSNPATEKLIGYKKEEFIGRTYSNLSIIDPEYLPMLQNHISLYFEGEKLPPIDVKLYKKDGSLIWANLISKTIKLGNETFLEVMGNDITERKNAELLIKKEVKKLKELDQIRKDLISRVSHELKTPLIPVLGGAEFLLNSYRHKFENDKEPLEILEMIEKGGNRLSKLVDNLLDVTRIDYEKFELQKNMANLSELIKETVKDMKYLIKKRDINLNLVIPDDLYLEIDNIRIEQVLTNLLSNAIKNTPPKGRVSLVLEKYGNWAIISVSDTGVGFTDEEMKKIFTKFGKIERYGEGLEYIDMEGSGLGLYITKQIVDLHNGKIWVESAGRNKGCIFKVRIPII